MSVCVHDNGGRRVYRWLRWPEAPTPTMFLPYFALISIDNENSADLFLLLRVMKMDIICLCFKDRTKFQLNRFLHLS
jgi:hypothetical protein